MRPARFVAEMLPAYTAAIASVVAGAAASRAAAVSSMFDRSAIKVES